jgi:DNA invertase Pin-like site-specific DNA recombinase
MSLKIAVYCRVSTLDQKNKETIVAQLDANSQSIKRYLKEHGGEYELLPHSPLKNEKDLRRIYFCDDGFNLESLQPGTAIVELLELVEAGQVQALKIDRPDRLFRASSIVVRATVQEILDRNNVKVFDHAGEIPRGMLLEITSAVSAYEKRETLRKLQNGKIAKLKRTGGPLNNRIPFGYRWHKKKEQWEVVEEEARIVRWAVAATSGRVTIDMPESLRMLVDEHREKPGVPDLDLIDALTALGFNMRGFYARTGMIDEIDRNPSGKLHEKFIYTLLRDRKYTGSRETRLTPGDHVGHGKKLGADKKVAIEMTYPAIVSEEDWVDMEAARRGRAKFYGKNIQHPYLVKDVAVCAHCDSKMQSASSFVTRYVKSEEIEKKYRSFSYKCNNRRANAVDPCDTKNNHRSKTVDEAVWEQVKRYLLDPNFVLQNERVVREDVRINQVIQKLEEEIKATNFELVQIEERETTMLGQLARKTITDEQFRKFSHMNTEDIRNLRRAKQKTQDEIDVKKKLLREIDRIDIEKIREKYSQRLDQLTFVEKRSIVLRVVRQVVLSACGVDYVDLFLPTSLKEKKDPVGSPDRRKV